MRAIWRPWVPKWGAQRDQTWSQWFILMYISIFYSFSTKDKQSGPLQKNQKKKTRFPDFYSTVVRKTAILQRKESSNQKIQEKEPLLTFKNTLKKVWANRKCQFLDSRRALLLRSQFGPIRIPFSWLSEMQFSMIWVKIIFLGSGVIFSKKNATKCCF